MPSNVLHQCKECKGLYDDVCKPCHKNKIKSKFPNWTSGNKKIDESIQEIQLNIDSSIDILFEWIPYSQFSEIKKIGEGGFATVYSAIWSDGPIRQCNIKNNECKGNEPNFMVALKCLQHNITDEFLHEVKAYSSHSYSDNILQIYGISQNPDTNDYVMVLQYAEGGNFNDWLKHNHEKFNWNIKLTILRNVIYGFKIIHEKNMVHRDFHGGNVLLNTTRSDLYDSNIYISDMGLSGEAGNIDQSKIYGVMPYIAPEVLRKEPYKQQADIYSFGMFMYLVATEKQPFANQLHDTYLAIKICSGIRPEINESAIPKCYIDLMKKCWDKNPLDRPDATEIFELISLFQNSYTKDSKNFKLVTNEEKNEEHYDIENQFKKAEYFRQSFIKEKNIPRSPTPQVSKTFFASRLLSPILSNSETWDEKWDNKRDEKYYDNTHCCSVNNIDFTKAFAEA